MPNPLYVNETQTLRQVMAHPKRRLKFTKHAKDKMAERNISAPDIIKVLTYGQVTLEEYKQDIIWRVEGKDLDGKDLSVETVVLEETITVKIVTAF
jgi:hypothetical protein